MSLLSAMFREAVKGKAFKDEATEEQQHSIAYPTGFYPLDYLNGYILRIDDREYFQTGLLDGSINAVISRPGEGKTTICIQMGANIIRPFENSTLFIDSAERGSPLFRLKQLTGFDNADFKARVIPRDRGVTIESVYNRIKQIRAIKVQNPDKFQYDTGIIDEYGEPIIKYIPTVYIMDSLKTIMPKNLVEDDGNNMDGARTASINSGIFTRLLSICAEANIIMLVINHISDAVSTSMMPQKSELAYLKQNEHLPGGKAAAKYLNNNILRLDNKSKLKSVDSFGIDGAIVNVEIIKSRSNKAGKGISLVFDQSTGYDKDLSLLLYLKDNNILEGGGAFLRLPGSDIKFSLKSFKNILYSNEDFYRLFMNVGMRALQDDLRARESHRDRIATIESQIKHPYDSILEAMNGGSDG